MARPASPYRDPRHEYAPGRIVPFVVGLVRPASVADWGCNNGVWLDAFRRNGVDDVHGFDRLPWSDDKYVGVEAYTRCDFEEDVPVRPCDLAVCLECAEHVRPARADVLVAALTASAPVVLFSAATPGQGGDLHLNEQPHSYWHYRFGVNGFACFDLVRWAVRDDPQIYPWYRNNLFLYARTPLPRRP